VIGERPEHDALDLGLRRDVGLGDEVARPLRGHRKPPHPILEHAPSGTGGGFADGKRIGHGCGLRD
jgi:hypothetical protein